MAVLNAVYAPPNQHQFNVEVKLPTEADELNFYFKIDISTIDAAPGTARVPNCREETIQFNVLGFWCNHMVLELLQAKILPKRARDHQKSQNF